MSSNDIAKKVQISPSEKDDNIEKFMTMHSEGTNNDTIISGGKTSYLSGGDTEYAKLLKENCPKLS